MRIVLIVVFTMSILSIPILHKFSSLLVEATGSDELKFLVPAIALGPTWLYLLTVINSKGEENEHYKKANKESV